jgi:periplasmic protein TonB
MSSLYKGFLISLFIHILFVFLVYAFFDTNSSMNRPLLIDLTFLDTVNELPGPKGPSDGGLGLKKDAGDNQVHPEKKVATTRMQKNKRPISKPQTTQNTQGPQKAANAPAQQLQPAIEPEGMVSMSPPHADASTPSAAEPPIQAAISGGGVISDAGSEGDSDSVQGSGPGAGEGPGSKNGITDKYVQKHFAYVRDIIQKNIIYPEMAHRRGWQGKVIISFVILENGCVNDINIKKSSGYSLLDDNVIKTVKTVSPFPRPPVESELLLPIVYRLEN